MFTPGLPSCMGYRRAKLFLPSREQWERTFDTNIHPLFYLSKYTLPHLQSGSTIINCASINPYIGRPDLLDYTSSKGAIVAFTRALSNQQVKKGIRVNCVCPGPGIFQPVSQQTLLHRNMLTILLTKYGHRSSHLPWITRLRSNLALHQWAVRDNRAR